MSNSPVNIPHTICPACLPIRAALALLLLILRSPPKSPLVKSEYRDPVGGEERVDVGVSPDVLCESVDEDNDGFRG